MDLEPVVQKFIADVDAWVNPLVRAAAAYEKLTGVARNNTNFSTAEQMFNRQAAAVSKLESTLRSLVNFWSRHGDIGDIMNVGSGRTASRPRSMVSGLTDFARREQRDREASARMVERLSRQNLPENWQSIAGMTASGRLTDPRAGARMLAGMSASGRVQGGDVAASRRMIEGMSLAGRGMVQEGILEADRQFAIQQARIRRAQGLADTRAERGASASDLREVFGEYTPEGRRLAGAAARRRARDRAIIDADRQRRQNAADLFGISAEPPDADPLAVGRRIRTIRQGMSWWDRTKERIQGAGRGFGAFGRHAGLFAGIFEMRRGLDSIFSGMGQAAQGIAQGGGQIGGSLLHGLGTTSQSLFGGATHLLHGVTSGQGTAAGVSVLGDVVGTGVESLAKIVGATFSGTGGAVGKAISGLGKSISGGIEFLGGAVGAALALGSGGTGLPISLAVVVGSQLAATLFRAVTGLVGGIVGAIGEVISSVVGTVGGILGSGLKSGAGMAGSVLQSMVNAGMRQEQTRLGFGALLGPVAGNAMFGDIKGMAGDSQYSRDVQAAVAQTLLISGLAPADVGPASSRLGAIGMGDPGRMGKLASLFGHVMDENVLSDSAARQFAALGVGGGDFAETMGVSEGAFKALSRTNMVPANVAVQTINRLTNPGGAFHELSHDAIQTTIGHWQRLDTVVQDAVAGMGEAFLKSSGIAEMMQSVGDWITNHMGDLEKFASVVGEFAGAGLHELGNVGMAVAGTLLPGGFDPEAMFGNMDIGEIVKGAMDGLVNATEAFATGLVNAGFVLADVIDALYSFGKAIAKYAEGWGNIVSELTNWNPLKKEFWIPPSLRGGGILNDKGMLPPSLRPDDSVTAADRAVAALTGGLRAGPGVVGNLFAGVRGNLDAQRAAAATGGGWWDVMAKQFGFGAEVNPNKDLSTQARDLYLSAVRKTGFGLGTDNPVFGTGMTPVESYQNQGRLIQELLDKNVVKPGSRELTELKYTSYEALRHSLGGIENYADHLTSAAGFGSSDAADTIAKAQLQTETTQEEILRTLTLANSLSGDLEKRMTEIRDYLQENAIPVVPIGPQ